MEMDIGTPNERWIEGLRELTWEDWGDLEDGHEMVEKVDMGELSRKYGHGNSLSIS